MSGIDLSRYEASPDTADTSTLKAAYTNSAYLTKRLQALELLDQFGKNAWLVANSQLEDMLREVEKELVETRGSVEGVNRERKGVQEGGRGQLEGGERLWREGVGRVVETEVAVGEVEGRWREGLRGKGR
jgi:pre-mRNA-splicing factor SPF27